MKSKLHSLKRPDDFIEYARRHGAQVRTGRGSRVVVRYQGRTIGFSRRGNAEYSKKYRLLLVKAFIAAGLLALLIMVAVRVIGLA